MHCKNCDYPLWNLKARQCPECGSPFRPSEFEFVINSVQFCCPNCNQGYFGTGPTGHLMPTDFLCVQCGRPVQMDAMVLRPATGVDESRTRVTSNPWLQRRKQGFFRSWMATIGRALVMPYRLMKETPVEGATGAAWWFAVVTAVAIWLTAILPWVILMIIPLSTLPGRGGGPGMSGALTGMGAGIGVAILMCVATTLLLIALNGLVAHGLLRLSGGTTHGLGRTYQAMCFASGANAVTAVPCLGGYIGWIWWLVSSVLAVKEAQRVHGGRAAFAVLTLPVALIITFIGLYVWLIVAMMSGGMVPGAVSQSIETTTVGQGVISYAAQNGGKGPAHASMLVSAGNLGTLDLVAMQTDTYEDGVALGDSDLESFGYLPPNRQRRAAQAAADALPPDVIAHRLGDFVFTYHGMDLSNADPGLWIVILWPDPDVNMTPAQVMVSRADGNTRRYAAPFAPHLASQNRLRAAAGLPPLPDPSTVTHDEPATPGP